MLSACDPPPTLCYHSTPFPLQPHWEEKSSHVVPKYPISTEVHLQSYKDWYYNIVLTTACHT